MFPPNRPRIWVAFDFDGTLAEFHGWGGPITQACPIAPAVALAKQHLDYGDHVVIFTARVVPVIPFSVENQRQNAEDVLQIQQWCLHHLGQALFVTAQKDYRISIYYDDRAVQMKLNTGEILGDNTIIHPAPSASQAFIESLQAPENPK